MKKEIIQYLDFEKLRKDLEEIYNSALSVYDENEQEIIKDCLDMDYYVNNMLISINNDMCKYLHLSDHTISGNFNNIDYNYPYDNGFTKTHVHDYEVVRAMVERLDNNQQDERTKDDRIYLVDWFWKTFGSWGMEYNLKNNFSEFIYDLNEED